MLLENNISEIIEVSKIIMNSYISDKDIALPLIKENIENIKLLSPDIINVVEIATAIVKRKENTGHSYIFEFMNDDTLKKLNVKYTPDPEGTGDLIDFDMEDSYIGALNMVWLDYAMFTVIDINKKWKGEYTMAMTALKLCFTEEYTGWSRDDIMESVGDKLKDDGYFMSEVYEYDQELADKYVGTKLKENPLNYQTKLSNTKKART